MWAPVSPEAPCAAARRCTLGGSKRALGALGGRECRDACLRRPLRYSVPENNGLVPIEQHAGLEVIANGAREDSLLNIATLTGQVIGRIGVSNMLNVLGNDRALVQI